MDGSQFEDDLSLRLKSFTLADVEQDDVILSQDNIVESEAECRSSLFSKVISQKPANLVGLKNTMEEVWGNPKNFQVLAVGDGIFQFVFPSELAVTRVLRGKPWFFNNHFLILERWKPNTPPKNCFFSFTPMWIQAWGIPLQFLSKDVGVKIGLKFGDVDDVVIPHSGSREGRFLRIRTVVDVTQPLKRGCMIKFPNANPTWVEFRYEKLPTFCRYCGKQGRRNDSPNSKGHQSAANSVSESGESLEENQGSDSRKEVVDSKNCDNPISTDLHAVTKDVAHAEMVTEAYFAESVLPTFDSPSITNPPSTFTLPASLFQNHSSTNSEFPINPKNASLIDIPILVDPPKAKIPRKRNSSVVTSNRGQSGALGQGRGTQQPSTSPLPSIKSALNPNGKCCHDPTGPSQTEPALSSPEPPIFPCKKARVFGNRGAVPHDSSCDMVAETSPKWSPATQ
ncbi:hypothetical protein Vadar_030611 [Vaccinium darrowii]|uniref:Uncharacterized protein n=1 Tax=Vaccinium darrowii TaxID=229202 RepID=A0ACB7Y4G4_9ERIC|nr:hypothetical protein Vadar_030611 [Vaccinium darrowii]